MRTRLMILSLTAFLAACGGGSDSTGPVTTGGGGGGGGGPVATTSVDMKGIAFSPAAIKVASGATVTWTNSDGFNHNVTFAGGAVAPSGNFATGSKALVMPTVAGTYNYSCTIHSGMSGTVTVQ
jgi:plastocyanin